MTTSKKSTAPAVDDTAPATPVVETATGSASIRVVDSQIPVQLTLKQTSISVSAMCPDMDTAQLFVDLVNMHGIEFSGKYQRPNKS